MNARSPGTCSATGRRYGEGAEIRKVGEGWVLDDDTTREALAARETATRIFQTADRDHGGFPVDVYGHDVGDLVWDRDGEVFVIVAVERHRALDYDLDVYKNVWRWHARLATEDEAAPVVAHLAAIHQYRAKAARRVKALAALQALPSQECSAPTAYSAKIALPSLDTRRHVHSPPSLDAYVVDGRVVLRQHKPDYARAPRHRLVEGTEAETLARAAALRVVEGGQITFEVPPLPDPSGRPVGSPLRPAARRGSGVQEQRDFLREPSGLALSLGEGPAHPFFVSARRRPRRLNAPPGERGHTWPPRPFRPPAYAKRSTRSQMAASCSRSTSSRRCSAFPTATPSATGCNAASSPSSRTGSEGAPHHSSS